MENAQLHKNIAEQATVIAQLRSDVSQTQQLLVTPRAKRNSSSVKGSILAELQSAFSNKFSQIPSVGLSARTPLTTSTTRTATDITELTPKRDLQKQLSDVSEPLSDREDEAVSITSRKEDMGTKHTEQVLIDENPNEDLEIQDVEISKTRHDSLLKLFFKYLISTVTSNIAKRPLVIAATTLTVGEVIDSWMSLFNVNAE